MYIDTILPQGTVNYNRTTSYSTTVLKSGQNNSVLTNKLYAVLQGFEGRVVGRITDTSEVLSPKVVELINVLNEYKSPNFHGIIFVDQRQVARALSWLLKQIPSVRSWVECSELTGHSENSGMRTTEQQETVKLFREGKLNLRASVSGA